MSKITEYLTNRIDAARASGDVPYAMALLADLERYERRMAIAANEAAEAEGVHQFGIQIEMTGRQIAELGQLIQASAMRDGFGLGESCFLLGRATAGLVTAVGFQMQVQDKQQ
jgi:hypothetical protein